MRVSFDEEADAAYITFGDRPIAPGEAETTVHSIQAPGGSEMMLDFDGSGRLLGIEVLSATGVLPGALLAHAALPGSPGGWWLPPAS
jgi:uncharacterized protein YuzE